MGSNGWLDRTEECLRVSSCVVIRDHSSCQLVAQAFLPVIGRGIPRPMLMRWVVNGSMSTSLHHRQECLCHRKSSVALPHGGVVRAEVGNAEILRKAMLLGHVIFESAAHGFDLHSSSHVCCESIGQQMAGRFVRNPAGAEVE